MTHAALRRHERISVPATVEIRAAGHGLSGTATVIGMGGMFLRAKDVQPPGAVFTLKLTCATLSIQVDCAVRYLTDHGMGIEFTSITPENDRKLRGLLDQIRT
jgi:PilZ domain-containing protein